MKIVRLNRDFENVKVDSITIEVGDRTYRLTESVDRKLCINSEGTMHVFPRYSNEVEVLSDER